MLMDVIFTVDEKGWRIMVNKHRRGKHQFLDVLPPSSEVSGKSGYHYYISGSAVKSSF
jgi:hypothetical protein